MNVWGWAAVVAAIWVGAAVLLAVLLTRPGRRRKRQVNLELEAEVKDAMLSLDDVLADILRRRA